ncbi:replication initiation protein RepM [Acinetobacter sp. YH16055]|uniref:replication initiation protein RepM n=1 Tax=Acinetobacter sp. YH16055 TaxID=2601193 RepID=UPI0015D2A44F|nr:replication initiation protein RepM [Acinetobacter sp. YH16055]
MPSDQLIVKDNALINASYNLDTVEQRLILLAILQAREEKIGIDANTRLRIHASEYMQRFDVNKHAAYKALKTAVTNLFGRQFSYYTIDQKTGKQKKIISRWVQNIAYIDDAATLEIAFTMDVIPLITRLEKQFTSYQLKQVTQLTGKYAIRLYELLIAWREVGKTPVFQIQDFRSKLGLEPNDYPRIDTFKRRVLESAVKQINEHTDIIVKVEQHKEGRSISGFSFSFKQKKEPKAAIPKHSEIITKMTTAQRHLFAQKLSEMPEMNKYSQGTESYSQFAVRIADMLQDPNKLQELSPYLKKAGYMPSK